MNSSSSNPSASNPPKSQVGSRSRPIKGASVNTAVKIGFSVIITFILTFLMLVIYTISLVREVKEVVAAENLQKAVLFQAAIDDPTLQDSLASKISTLDANVLKLEDDLDDTVDLVLVLCAANLILILVSTVNTMLYVKNHVVNPLLLFKDEVAKLSQGQLDLDFHCDSRALEVQQLSISLTESTEELRRIVTILKMNVTELSNKNFSELVSADFPGDFKVIEDGFQHLVVVVAGTLREIITSAHEVSIGANQVSSGAQVLAQGATEQTSSVEHLSSTIGEIAKMVSDTADSAVNANNLGQTAGVVLDNSSKEMEELMDAIAQIERSSSDIEQIIKTIDDIAFQTNILALNAAIEAARAGQFGKSFAVVADEVRSLAQKSAIAAHDTTALIESSLEAIRRGASLAGRTNDAFAEVKENSMQVLEVVQHIADSSKIQSGSIDDICASVGEISAVIASNSATSEESAAASEELSSQADAMSGMLGSFQISQRRYR